MTGTAAAAAAAGDSVTYMLPRHQQRAPRLVELNRRGRSAENRRGASGLARRKLAYDSGSRPLRSDAGAPGGLIRSTRWRSVEGAACRCACYQM